MLVDLDSVEACFLFILLFHFYQVVWKSWF